MMSQSCDTLYEDSMDKKGCISQGNLSAHMHYHAEMILSLKGSFGAVIDGRQYVVEEGAGVIVFPYQLHEYLAIDSEKAAVMLLNPERNKRLYEYFKGQLPRTPILSRELVDDEIRSLTEYMLVQSIKSWELTDDSGEIVGIYKELLFALILNKLEYEPVVPSKIDAMRQVLFWCQEHFTEPVTIPVAAKALLISESQLSHLFSGRIHVGFRDYINSLRVQMATIMLTETDKPISEIAFDCGFTSFSTFNRAFRLSTGMTPREMRKRGKR